MFFPANHLSPRQVSRVANQLSFVRRSGSPAKQPGLSVAGFSMDLKKNKPNTTKADMDQQI